jgi:hypothetical protein
MIQNHWDESFRGRLDELDVIYQEQESLITLIIADMDFSRPAKLHVPSVVEPIVKNRNGWFRLVDCLG